MIVPSVFTASELELRSPSSNLPALPGGLVSPVIPPAFPNLDEVLDCPICLELLVEPVSLPCGHTFCRPCLVESLSRLNKRCPSCRALCHVDPVAHPESTVLREVVVRLHPRQYEERLASVAEARLRWTHRHPIFFYRDVTFPTAPVAFGITDPRYRLLMERVADGQKTFIWLPTVRQFEVHRGDLGVLCRLSEFQRLADGRYYFSAVAESRVVVLEAWRDTAAPDIHYAAVQPYTDAPLDAAALTEIESTLRTHYTSLREVVETVPQTAAFNLPELPEMSASPTLTELERVTWRCCAALFSLLMLGNDRLFIGGALLTSRDPRTRITWIGGCVDQLQAYLAVHAAAYAEQRAARRRARQERLERRNRLRGEGAQSA